MRLARLGFSALFGALYLTSVGCSTAEVDAGQQVCTVLAEARATLLGPDVIRLGEASEVMKKLAGMTLPDFTDRMCRPQEIKLAIFPNGTMLSFSFDFPELQNPDIWCGFGLDPQTALISLPYCRGK